MGSLPPQLEVKRVNRTCHQNGVFLGHDFFVRDVSVGLSVAALLQRVQQLVAVRLLRVVVADDAVLDG